jgi:hypothetical protein
MHLGGWQRGCQTRVGGLPGGLGELMREMPKAEGTLKVGPQVPERPTGSPPSLASLGIDKHLADRVRR